MKNVAVWAGMGILGLVIYSQVRREFNADRVAESVVSESVDVLVEDIEKATGGKPTRRSGKSQGNLVEDLFQIGADVLHQGSKMGNDVFYEIMGLSEQEEIEVGRQTHKLVLQKHRVIQDSQRLNSLQQLAQPFLEARHRPGIPYTFTIVDDPAVNAFATVGGYVYVNSGLLERIQDENELRFVLGHEIAHSDLKHCAKAMTVAVRSQEIAGGLSGLAMLAYKAIAVGYSEDQELESDAWSYLEMRKQGIDHAQCALGLKMLERELGGGSHSHGQGPGVAVEVISDHFRTHPPVKRRLKQLEALRKTGDRAASGS